MRVQCKSCGDIISTDGVRELQSCTCFDECQAKAFQVALKVCTGLKLEVGSDEWEDLNSRIKCAFHKVMQTGFAIDDIGCDMARVIGKASDMVKLDDY